MNKIRIAILAGVWLTTLSCSQKEPDKDEFDRLIEEEVDRRLSRWSTIKMRRCEEDLLVEANLLADSIILEEARLAATKKDKPAKPIKPERPTPISIQDTIPLAPIFERDSNSN